jgi:hypothetical protein
MCCGCQERQRLQSAVHRSDERMQLEVDDDTPVRARESEIDDWILHHHLQRIDIGARRVSRGLMGRLLSMR